MISESESEPKLHAETQPAALARLAPPAKLLVAERP